MSTRLLALFTQLLFKLLSTLRAQYPPAVVPSFIPLYERLLTAERLLQLVVTNAILTPLSWTI